MIIKSVKEKRQFQEIQEAKRVFSSLKYFHNSKIMEHFLSPINSGELVEPDGIGIEKDNPWMINIKITIKVNNGHIKEIRFKTTGCVTAIASASILTELATGKSIQEAASISDGELSEALGKVPNEKLHCCRLAINSLRDAIKDYKRLYL